VSSTDILTLIMSLTYSLALLVVVVKSWVVTRWLRSLSERVGRLEDRAAPVRSYDAEEYGFLCKREDLADGAG
jgi:hypothetical protein